eukprot:TRINITY_DN6386_c2_g1_i6.p1 TRINITY_DN6386_c2_g1~~TRINITY_DN6386_c2_g1_i6.p1  ORF type:complete len:480 (+),score=47.08 TRINITY_DN6386_c2_g1_i6:66-1442(+)
MKARAERIYSKVVDKVRHCVNSPFPEENECDIQENIMRRRDSVCIMMSNRLLQSEFPDDDLSPRFMFDHPTIESMAHSLCGSCECSYCSAEVEDFDDFSENRGSAAVPSWLKDEAKKREIATFTQLVDEPAAANDASTAFAAGVLHKPCGANGRFARVSDGMECVLVPGTVAWVGSETLAKAGCKPLLCEQPCHEVRLNSFFMDVEPVSIGSYARFLNIVKPTQEELLEWCVLSECDERSCFMPIFVNSSGKWAPKPTISPRWPMILVSWYGANAYALWANGHDWTKYRDSSHSFLPTEAQWEYAARGSLPKSFPWGDTDPTPDLLQVSWGIPKHDDLPLEDFSLVDVNVELGVSEFGLRHMAGNVWQWCRDTYDPNFYLHREAQNTDAWNADEGDLKSERGGSWVGPACLARSSYRRGRTAVAKGRCLGFRCVGVPPGSTVEGSEPSSASSTRAPST